MWFSPTLHHKLRFFLNNQLLSFKAKNEYLVFHFVVVCQTCRWYYRIGHGALFPKSDIFRQNPLFPTKKREFLKKDPKNDMLCLHINWHMSRPSIWYKKEVGRQNGLTVAHILIKWLNLLIGGINHQFFRFCCFLGVDCKKLWFFSSKISTQK